MLDPLGAVTKTRQALDDEEEQQMEAAPISISQREMLLQPVGENYFYSPGLGDVPQIDVPLDLPDLPGMYQQFILTSFVQIFLFLFILFFNWKI